MSPDTNSTNSTNIKISKLYHYKEDQSRFTPLVSGALIGLAVGLLGDCPWPDMERTIFTIITISICGSGLWLLAQLAGFVE